MPLAVRVIPVVLYKGTQAVKSVNFKNHRNIGSVVGQAKLYNARNVDELILLDIDSSTPNWNGIKAFGEVLFCPFTVGGGFRSFEEVQKAISLCADKVAIPFTKFKSCYINELSEHYGKQAIVCTIDVAGGELYYPKYPTALEGESLSGAIYEASYYCGEILLTSVDREGTMKGYDLDLIEYVKNLNVEVPVVINGGAGKPKDFVDAVNMGADALAASSIFQFTKVTPKMVKEEMAKAGINVRL